MSKKFLAIGLFAAITLTPFTVVAQKGPRCSLLNLRRIFGLDKLRLRGSSGAKDEFLLAPPPEICGSWRSSSPFRFRR